MFIKFFKVSQKAFFFVFLFLQLPSNCSIASGNRTFVYTADGSALIFGISLVKDTLLSYEPFLIEIWLKNSSEDSINSNFAPLVGWTITDVNGKEYPPKIHITPGLLVVSPGDSLNWRIDLSGRGISTDNSPSHFPSGSYMLSYWLFGDSIPPLTFTIIEPSGEEAKALELYLKYFPLMKQEENAISSKQDFKKICKEKIACLIRVADRYPKSVYAAKALSGAAISAWSVDKELAYRLNLRVFSEYSDPFRNCFGFLNNYYDTKKDSMGFRLELKKIIDSSSDSELVVRAKRYLQRLTEKK